MNCTVSIKHNRNAFANKQVDQFYLLRTLYNIEVVWDKLGGTANAISMKYIVNIRNAFAKKQLDQFYLQRLGPRERS